MFELIDALPEIRSKALSETSGLRAGSRTEMVDGCFKVAQRLLPSLVTLEAAMRKTSEKATREQILRDLEAIRRDAQIRGNSGGWGGTGVSLDEYTAYLSHVENRISYCVWMLSKGNASFDFEAWRRQWIDQGEQ